MQNPVEVIEYGEEAQAAEEEISDEQHAANFAELKAIRQELKSLLTAADSISLDDTRQNEIQSFRAERSNELLHSKITIQGFRQRERQSQLDADASTVQTEIRRVEKNERRNKKLMIDDLNTLIKSLSQQAAALPYGEERSLVENQKNELIETRNRLHKESVFAAFSAEIGSQPLKLSNETRTAQEIKNDIEQRNKRSRKRAAEQLASFADLMTPRTYKL